jgi:uncharacterized protein
VSGPTARTAARLGLVLVLLAAAARAADLAPPSGDELARRVNARDDGAAVSRTLRMELVDKRGQTRTRTTRSYRRDVGDERRSVLFFVDPTTVKGTAFLTWDYPDPHRDDDQWLYLPALRKSRRIAAGDRGQSFLGTDLSYEDMKNETRLGVADYRWTTQGEERVDGHRCWLLEGLARDDATAHALGYGRILVRVDAELAIPRRVEYWDPKGELLKTVDLREIEAIQGIWTPQLVEVRNHQTGHATIFRFEDVDYAHPPPEDLMTEGALRRGPPD